MGTGPGGDRESAGIAREPGNAPGELLLRGRGTLETRAGLALGIPSSPEDWAEIRKICCQNGGAVASDLLRWPFFGEQWIGAYERYAPEWASVLRAPDGRVAGYLTGCPDTSQFDWQRRLGHWPRLAAGILGQAYPWNSDTRQFSRRSLGWEKSPARAFSPETRLALRDRYPAHLHVNLRAQFQGCRAGDLLLEDFFGKLSAAHVPGVHVHCGQGPLAFYLRLGFQVLQQIEYRPGNLVFALGLGISR